MKKVTISMLLISCILLLQLKKQNQDSQKGFLHNEMAELESYFKFKDSLNKGVSKATVAWHLDHSIRTINEIYKAVKNSDPDKFKGSIHLGRSFILLTNRIPRGGAQSPKIVRPPNIIRTDSLYIYLKEAKQRLIAYDSLPKRAFFKHPYLGSLKKKTAKRFLEIHTEHHLKIIRDILKK
ncbi:MAG: DUF1569 domain-containing protein [Saonia sp.]